MMHDDKAIDGLITKYKSVSSQKDRSAILATLIRLYQIEAPMMAHGGAPDQILEAPITNLLNGKVQRRLKLLLNPYGIVENIVSYRCQ